MNDIEKAMSENKNDSRTLKYILNQVVLDGIRLDRSHHSWNDSMSGKDDDLTPLHFREWLRTSMMTGVELFINSLDEKYREKFFELMNDSSDELFEDVRRSKLVNYPLELFLSEEFSDEMIKASKGVK